jgi:gamma-glutamyltranspeptidase/glutathione hydrolase
MLDILKSAAHERCRLAMSARPARSPVYGPRFMAVTGHSLATLAAVKIFEGGGNIVDAMIAASAATAAVLGHAAGIGGDCFILYRDAASNRIYGLNASGTAPELATPEIFVGGMQAHGPLAAVVPGLVRAWETMHTRFGRMKWSTLFEAAIALAEAHPVSQVLATRLAAQTDELRGDPGSATIYLPDGRPIGIGETLHQPALAASLRRIADEGADAFYRGPIAHALDAHSRAHGGLLRATDLAAYEPLWVDPIASEYREHIVHVMPPNSCGALLLLQLNGLAAVDRSVLTSHPALRMGYQMSAMKAALAIGVPLIADPSAVPDTVDLLLSSEMTTVMRGAVLSLTDAKTGTDSGGTSCLIFADAEGNAITLVQSVFNVFGAGVLEPSTGILLNNRMQGFMHKPGKANSVGPNKRPAHTLCPVMVTRGDRLRFAMATPGGLSQTLTNVQVLSHLVDAGLDVQAAVEHPRWCNTKTGDFLMECEFEESVVAELAALGHKAKRLDDGYYYGSAKVIEMLPSGNLAGAADFRREAFALGL